MNKYNVRGSANNNNNSSQGLLIKKLTADYQCRFSEEGDNAFKDFIFSCIAHSESTEFFKLKEYFLQLNENRIQIPNMEPDVIDHFIEIYLIICQKHPTPLAKKAFIMFSKLLLNNLNLEPNKIITQQFKCTQQNIDRLGIKSYFKDKDCHQIAIDLTCYFIEHDESFRVIDVTVDPELIEEINSISRSRMFKNLNFLLKDIQDLKSLKDKNENLQKKIHEYEQDALITKTKIQDIDKNSKDIENLRIYFEQLFDRLNKDHEKTLIDALDRVKALSEKINQVEENHKISNLANEEVKKDYMSMLKNILTLQEENNNIKNSIENNKQNFQKFQDDSKLTQERIQDNIRKLIVENKHNIDENNKVILEINNTLYKHFSIISSLSSKANEFAEYIKTNTLQQNEFKEIKDKIRIENEDCLNKLMFGLQGDFSDMNNKVRKLLEDQIICNNEIRMNKKSIIECESKIENLKNGNQIIKDEIIKITRKYIKSLGFNLLLIISTLELEKQINDIYQATIKLDNYEKRINQIDKINKENIESSMNNIQTKIENQIDKLIELKISNAFNTLSDQQKSMDITMSTLLTNSTLLREKVFMSMAPKLDELWSLFQANQEEVAKLIQITNIINSKAEISQNQLDDHQIKLIGIIKYLGIKFDTENKIMIYIDPIATESMLEDLQKDKNSNIINDFYKKFNLLVDETNEPMEIKYQALYLQMQFRVILSRLPLFTALIKDLNKKIIGEGQDIENIVSMNDLQQNINDLKSNLSKEIENIQKNISTNKEKSRTFANVLEQILNNLELITRATKSEWIGIHSKIKEIDEKILQIPREIRLEEKELADFKKKYDELLTDLKGIAFISKGTYQAGEQASNEIFIKINNNTLTELKEKLSKLETITYDYIKLFVEPESLTKGQQIAKPYILIEEKLSCFLFLIRNYKLINVMIVKKAFSDFKESLSKTNLKTNKFKMDAFEEVYKIIKHLVNLDTEQFYYLLELFYMFTIEEQTNIKKCYDYGIFRFFIGLIRKNGGKLSVRTTLLKILSYLTRYDEFFKLILDNKLLPMIYSIVHPIFESYTKELNLDILSSNIHKTIGISNTNEQSNIISKKDIMTTIDFINQSDIPIEEIDNMNANSAMVYYGILWIYEIYRKDKSLIDQAEVEYLINIIHEIASKKKTPIYVKDILLQMLLLITRITRKPWTNTLYQVTYQRIIAENSSLLETIWGISKEKRYPAELNKLAQEILSYVRPDKPIDIIYETKDQARSIEPKNVRKNNNQILPSIHHKGRNKTPSGNALKKASSVNRTLNDNYKLHESADDISIRDQSIL